MALTKILAASQSDEKGTRKESMSFDLIVGEEWILRVKDVPWQIGHFELGKIGQYLGSKIKELGHNEYEIINGDYIGDSGRGVAWVNDNGGAEQYRKSRESRISGKHIVDPNFLDVIERSIYVTVQRE